MEDLGSLLRASRIATASAAFGARVAIHLSIISVEIDYKIWRLLGVYVVLLMSLAGLYRSLCEFPASEIAVRILLVGTSFNAGLSLSMGMYRLFFHRLRKFPGPIGARLSRFYTTALASKKIQYYLEVKKIHETYGDFVRTGPREITVFRASAVNIIHGPQTACRKSSWYSQVSDDVTKCSLNSSRDFEDHKRRRRAWDQGFSVKALKSYELRIKALLDLLISQIKAKEGFPIDVTAWSMFFTFDVMGAVGFSKEFHMLRDGTEHSAIKGLHDQMTTLGILSSIPWFLSMVGTIPGLAGSYAPFTKWCGERVEEKEKAFIPNEYPRDIFSWLLKAGTDKDISAVPGKQALIEDGRLIIIAGSETTASTVANAIYFLCRYPETYHKLQLILKEVFPNGQGDWSFENIRAIPYLEEIINETMRLKPAVPSGVPRITPSKGLQIDEVFIPGDINVITPTYLMQRDARYFQEPDSFIPERWLDKGYTMIREKSVFAPFSLGVYGCIGKNLALMQLRGVISLIAMKFDLDFAPGETGVAFDTEALDTFTMTLPPLKVLFKERR